MTGSWFMIGWLRNLAIYQEPAHVPRQHATRPRTGPLNRVTKIKLLGRQPHCARGHMGDEERLVTGRAA